MQYWRVIGTVGVVAALSGLFLNLAASPAIYSALDAMFAAGTVTALSSVVFIKK